MAIKEQVLQNMINAFSKDLVQRKEPWVPFLDTASYMYKYRFENQLAIYLQNEQATACASMTQWNRMGRDIIKGHPGIRLAARDRFGEHLYVWDVNDTDSRDASNEIKLWQMTDTAKERIKEYLEDVYYLSEKGTLKEQLEAAAKDAAAESFIDIAEKMMEDNPDDPNLVNDILVFSEIIEKSAIYITAKRCGLKTEISEDDFPFDKLSEKSPDFDYLYEMGSCLQAVCMDILSGIEKEVKTFLANERSREYNIKKEKEREEEYERDDTLQGSRGISTSGLLGETTTEGDSREIGNDEERLPERREAEAVHAAVSTGGFETTSSEHREGGSGNERDSDSENEEGRGDYGGAESTEFEFVDFEDEGNSAESRENYFGGYNIQLNLFGKIEEEEAENGNRADETLFFDSKVFPDVLRCSISFDSWLDRLNEGLASEDNEKRLTETKWVYENCYCGIVAENGDNYVAHADKDGFVIMRGKVLSKNGKAYTYSWDDTVKKLLQMQSEDELYFDEKTPQFITVSDVENILSSGSMTGFTQRTKEFFAKEESRKLRADFLKNEFGIGGRGCPGRASASWDAKGVKFTKRNCKDLYYSWSSVCEVMEPLLVSAESFFEDTISDQREYSAEEINNKIEIPVGLKLEEDDRQFVIAKVDYEAGKVKLDDISGIYPITRVESIEYVQNWIKKEDVSHPEQRKYVRALGEHIFLEGNHEYRIRRVDERDVYLDDLENPFIAGRVIMQSDFDEKLSENPLNDHLLSENFKEFPKEVENVTVIEEITDAGSSKIGFKADENEEQSNNTTEKTETQAEIMPSIDKSLYTIHNMELGHGKKSEKYQRNIDAIKLLKKLEAQNLRATDEEKDVLASYIGWGGLPEVFEEGRPQFDELKSILTDEEYKAAKASVLNSHYTSPVIIQKMYDILDNLGFEGGKVLEPAMGVGNFFGMMPEKLRRGSHLYGVELDSISGRIARKLYPAADIQIKGFEETSFKDNSIDVAIGNVPFGQYSVNDKEYNNRGFKIHDYFFAKTIDKVKAGGLILFITSRYTMDKKNSSVREYIAQRAELLGAIRLPNTAFKANAGTEVTSDILILQKKEVPEVVDETLSWLNLGTDDNGLVYNQYFIEHPEMVIGNMVEVSGRFGFEPTCQLGEEDTFTDLLSEAVRNIKGKIQTIEYFDEMASDNKAIPALPDAPDYSYSLVDGKLYYREGSIMQPAELGTMATQRAKGMIALRELLSNVIELQVEDASDEEISGVQKKLKAEYEKFTGKYGLINSKANSLAFREDASYPLLASLELVDEDGELIKLAEIFEKRTVRKAVVVETVSNAAEALAVCLDQCGKVDIEYMCQLSEMTEEELVKELEGIIFRVPDIENPEKKEYITADEYLSGNVRSKLNIARVMAKADPSFEINVSRLENALPEWIDASKLDARLGSIWIPPDVYEDFVKELLELPSYAANQFHIIYNEVTGVWNIPNKGLVAWQAAVNTTYGTSRANAYRIIENSLNMKTVQITETTIDADGKTHITVNQEETAKACQKQDLIKQKFVEWIWKEPERRKRLEEIYNVRFNSNVAREYDGSHLTYPGMNPEITLRPHQNRAVARQLYGGNTLLAHAVGAGKTYEMIAAIMEKKRLGLCTKAMLVVPNHLTGQWAKEFMTLYPTAKVLAVTKKDFTPANRKRFCSRIATGDYDAVIIGHSQFEMIPLSIKRQREFIEAQLDDVMTELEAQRAANGQSITVKQLQTMSNNLRTKLQKLNEGSRKDNVVTFEQLGIDHLGVDEAHEYKNLALVTKMNNVAGISATGANKSYDMFAKCRYIDELTHGRGITFATGTPVSNSMAELYTMQKYLQYDELKNLGLITFDAWASTFGETITSWELAPEGTKYRQRTRFAKFFNLPELMSIFRNVADIETGENLNLDLPEAIKENILVKPTMRQLEIIREIGERADAIHDNKVDARVDNMLKITTDGRKLALDERVLTGEKEHPFGKTKVDVLIENCLRIYNETAEEKGTQLIFCDLSTPNSDGSFSVYEEFKKGLISEGVPEKEIAFIHDANTEAKKEELFSSVRQGKVRFLMGSTRKMGAGMNVQNRLIALHHLDVPWRPADIEQQEGRIIRQGNQNETVYIYRYLTENSFDAYSWQTLEIKQRFISQIMNGKNPARSCEDIDETSMDFAEVKAICTGDPTIKEKMELENDVKQLQMMRETWQADQFRFQDMLYEKLPQNLKEYTDKKEALEKDVQLFKLAEEKPFEIEIGDAIITDEKKAGVILYDLSVKYKESENWKSVGKYKGFGVEVNYYDGRYRLRLAGAGKYNFDRGAEPYKIVEKLNKVLEGFDEALENYSLKVEQTRTEMDRIKKEIDKPFYKEEELKQKEARLAELNEKLLNDNNGNEKASDKRKAFVIADGYITMALSNSEGTYLVLDKNFEEIGHGTIKKEDMCPADILEESAKEFKVDITEASEISWEDYEEKMEEHFTHDDEERAKIWSKSIKLEEELD